MLKIGWWNECSERFQVITQQIWKMKGVRIRQHRTKIFRISLHKFCIPGIRSYSLAWPPGLITPSCMPDDLVLFLGSIGTLWSVTCVSWRPSPSLPLPFPCCPVVFLSSPPTTSSVLSGVLGWSEILKKDSKNYFCRNFLDVIHHNRKKPTISEKQQSNLLCVLVFNSHHLRHVTQVLATLLASSFHINTVKL